VAVANRENAAVSGSSPGKEAPDYASSMLSNLSKILISTKINAIIESKRSFVGAEQYWSADEDASNPTQDGHSSSSITSKLIYIYLKVFDMCNEILHASIEIDAFAGTSTSSASSDMALALALHPDIEAALLESPVGMLLGPMIHSLIVFLQEAELILLHVETSSLFSSMITCLTSIQQIIPKLSPKKPLDLEDTSRASGENTLSNISNSEIYEYESLHPYPSDTDQFTPFHFPGATRLCVTFSQECKFKDEGDFLIFFKDSSHGPRWHTESKFSGILP
jgi:hypothetical protein